MDDRIKIYIELLKSKFDNKKELEEDLCKTIFFTDDDACLASIDNNAKELFRIIRYVKPSTIVNVHSLFNRYYILKGIEFINE